jgi:hypothetical protein
MTNRHPLAVTYRALVTARNVILLAAKSAWACGCIWLAASLVAGPDIGMLAWVFVAGLLLLRGIAPFLVFLCVLLLAGLASTPEFGTALRFFLAGLVAYYGIDPVIEALPSLTPRQINEAPGRSRLASRDELRRGRVIRG